MDDYLREVQEREEIARKERAQRAADWQAKKAAEAEYEIAWKAVGMTCSAGDEDPSTTPDLSTFIALANVLRQRGWHEWLPEMHDRQREPLGHSDGTVYRPGTYWMTKLLLTALERDAEQQLLADYQSLRADRVGWKA